MRKPTTTIETPSIVDQLSLLSGLVFASVMALCVIVAAYDGGRLLEGFYLVMGGVFVAGAIAAVRGFFGFSRESRAQKRLLEAVGKGELWSTIRGWTEDSLSWRVLFCLSEQQFVAPKSVREDGFLDGMQTRLVASARFVGGCGDVCVSLGLLGTAAGLTVMLEDLQAFAATGKMIAGDGGGKIFEQLFRAGGPLDGLAASFATTVVGLAARLILSNIAKVQQVGADRLTDYLADNIAMNIGPENAREEAA